MGLFLHKVYRLMAEQGLTYSEACSEVGRHGAKRQKAVRRHEAAKWISAKPLYLSTSTSTASKPAGKPAPAPRQRWEQAQFDFE